MIISCIMLWYWLYLALWLFKLFARYAPGSIVVLWKMELVKRYSFFAIGMFAEWKFYRKLHLCIFLYLFRRSECFAENSICGFFGIISPEWMFWLLALVFAFLCVFAPSRHNVYNNAFAFLHCSLFWFAFNPVEYFRNCPNVALHGFFN